MTDVTQAKAQPSKLQKPHGSDQSAARRFLVLKTGEKRPSAASKMLICRSKHAEKILFLVSFFLKAFNLFLHKQKTYLKSNFLIYSYPI